MARKQNLDNHDDDPVLIELVAIKRLLAYAIMRSGAKQDDIAAALGVGQATVSRMFKDGMSKQSKPTRARGK